MVQAGLCALLKLLDGARSSTSEEAILFIFNSKVGNGLATTNAPATL